MTFKWHLEAKDTEIDDNETIIFRLKNGGVGSYRLNGKTYKFKIDEELADVIAWAMGYSSLFTCGGQPGHHKMYLNLCEKLRKKKGEK